MGASEPKGLLTIWADIDADYKLEFLKWHNCQHMNERVTIPGFHVGHRYRAMGEERDFFMVYETDTAEIMRGEAYLYSQNNPTPWTRESIGHFQKTKRIIYTLVASEGGRPATDAPYLLLVSSNPPDEPGAIEEVTRWYQEEHLPRLCRVPEVSRGRLYQAEKEISNITTAESKVHEASTGDQEFLAMYELFSSEVVESDAWIEAARGTERSKKMLGALRDMSRDQYWLDFSMWAPGK